MLARYGARLGKFDLLHRLAAVPITCFSLVCFYVWRAERLIILVSRSAKRCGDRVDIAGYGSRCTQLRAQLERDEGLAIIKE